MAVPSATSGTLGHLTQEEQRKLQQAWIHILRLGGTDKFDGEDTLLKHPDKTEQFRQLMSNKSPEVFKQRLWSYNLAEHPDVIVLRFLRARKWDVDAAMNMLVSAINWRDERRIDEVIIRDGESVGLKDKLTKDESGFVNQYRSGKSYVRGTDKNNRPIYVIKVRLHDPSAQSGESMETYVLHNFESIRALIGYPNERACLLFDMTKFGLKNMDFHVVRFLVHVFEARYPETLGCVLIHNAPFVFWGVWRVIKPWLDPVIASKIHFTRGSSELESFIDKENLQKEYGGNDKWEYLYVEPTEGENSRMQDDATRAALQEEQIRLCGNFDAETVSWVILDPGSEEGKAKDAKRVEAHKEIRANYWKLDPYIRAKTYYHRVGVVTEEGEVDFMGAAAKSELNGTTTNGTNGSAGSEK